MLVYKCHYKVIHRVWRTSTVSWGLLPLRPLSSLPISPVHAAEPSLSSLHIQFNKSTEKKQSKKILHPGSQDLGRCLRGLSHYGPRSPLQGAGTTRPVNRCRSSTQSQVGGWPHNPVRPVQPCSGMEMGGSSMADALSQTPAAVGCRMGWDNFPNKTKKTKNPKIMKAKVFQLLPGLVQLFPLTPVEGSGRGPRLQQQGRWPVPFPSSMALQTTPCIALRSHCIQGKPPPPVAMS